MDKVQFTCVDCGSEMQTGTSESHCQKCAKVYSQVGSVWQATPTNLSELAREEAEYHDHFDENAADVHQLGAWRNFFYHRLLWRVIQTLPVGSQLLEIGAGSGFDSKEFQSYDLTLSDISRKTLERLAQRLNRDDATFVACDGSKLPFPDGTFSGVYTLATWHHFHEPELALLEMRRVLKPNGLLVIGVEPNRFYFRYMKKFRTTLCAATHGDEHEGSHADAEMEGFSYRELKHFFGNNNWSDVHIRPMWFLAGWLHYGLEFFYRVFKLKRRIRIPQIVEKIIVGLDEIFFRIPPFNRLGWHWIILARKK